MKKSHLYNIDKVKEYFFYYILGPHFGSPDNYIKDPKLYIDNCIRGPYVLLPLVVFLSGIVLFFGLGIGWIIGPIIGIFGAIFLMYGYIKIIRSSSKRGNALRSLIDYFHAKKELEGSLEILTHKMANDIRESGINPLEVELISKIIKQISSSLSFISGPLIDFRNADTFLKSDQKLVLEKFILIETTFLIEYIKSFQHILDTWKKNHIAELTEINQSLEDSNISSLQVASTQLKIQKENLEKVQVQSI